MDGEFFPQVTGPIPFGGLDAASPLSFKVYEPDRIVLGKRMEDQLRIAVCVWHNFAAPGADMFGSGKMSGIAPGSIGSSDPMAAARAKMAATFEFLSKLGVPFYTFHDRDIAPEARTFAESQANFEAMVGEAEAHMARTRREAALGHGQSVLPSPIRGRRSHQPGSRRVRLAAAQVRSAMDATHKLGAPTTSSGAAAKATTRSSTPNGA